MERPTKLYPTAPKPEWFMRASNGLQHNQTTGVDAASFVKMSLAQYTEYLSAHDKWVENVHLRDSKEHDLAVAKRGLSNFREVPSGFRKANGEINKTPSSRYVQIPGVAETVWVKQEKKVEHKPTLSHKSHKGEKRAEKQKLANERTKVSVEVIKAKTDSLVNQIPRIREVVHAVDTIRVEKPLHNAQLGAAQHAARRVKAVASGSVDLVANVEPDNGWKIVTRSKGDRLVSLSKIEETITPNGSSWVVSKDPVASNALVPKTAVRRPESQVAK